MIPVALSASATIPLDSFTPVMLDLGALNARARVPMLIEEFRFQIATLRLGSGNYGNNAYTGLSIREGTLVQINVGPHRVTSGFVSLGHLAGPVQPYLEATGCYRPDIYPTATDTLLRRWILPKPMYLPPNFGIRVEVARQNETTGASPSITKAFTIACTIVGKAIVDARRYRKTVIPFVAPAGNANTGTVYPYDAMRNVLNKAVHVQKILVNKPSGILDDAAVRVADSLGYTITTGYVAPGRIVQRSTGALIIDRVLPAGGFYTLTPPVSVASSGAGPFIAMHAYREETV